MFRLDERQRFRLRAGLAVGGFAAVFVLGALFDPGVRPPGPPAVRGGVASPEGLPNYAVDPDAGARKVDELARRSGGDFDRLTPLEQRWMDALTAGHGREMIRMRARQLREQAATARRGRGGGRSPRTAGDR